VFVVNGGKRVVDHVLQKATATIVATIDISLSQQRVRVVLKTLGYDCKKS